MINLANYCSKIIWIRRITGQTSIQCFFVSKCIKSSDLEPRLPESVGCRENAKQFWGKLHRQCCGKSKIFWFSSLPIRLILYFNAERTSNEQQCCGPQCSSFKLLSNSTLWLMIHVFHGSTLCWGHIIHLITNSCIQQLLHLWPCNITLDRITLEN